MQLLKTFRMSFHLSFTLHHNYIGCSQTIPFMSHALYPLLRTHLLHFTALYHFFHTDILFLMVEGAHQPN